MRHSPDVALPRGASVRTTLRDILAGPKVRRAAQRLAKLCVSDAPFERLRDLPQSAQHHPKTFPSRKSNQYVPSAIRDVAEHMAEAAAQRHPFDHEGRSLQADAKAAIKWYDGKCFGVRHAHRACQGRARQGRTC